MKKITFVLCFLSLWTHYIFAEETTIYETFRNEIEQVFEEIDKNQVPTGLLEEYGFHLVPLSSYNGVTTESNYVTPMIWEMLYSDLYDSRINDKCQMQTPEETYSQSDGNLCIMYYKYNAFADDALERGLVTFEDEKIRLVPGKPSPYVEKECFAVMPTDGSLPLAFDKSNLFTNTGLDVTKIEYKIGNGDYIVI